MLKSLIKTSVIVGVAHCATSATTEVECLPCFQKNHGNSNDILGALDILCNDAWLENPDFNVFAVGENCTCDLVKSSIANEGYFYGDSCETFYNTTVPGCAGQPCENSGICTDDHTRLTDGELEHRFGRICTCIDSVLGEDCEHVCHAGYFKDSYNNYGTFVSRGHKDEEFCNKKVNVCTADANCQKNNTCGDKSFMLVQGVRSRCDIQRK